MALARYLIVGYLGYGGLLRIWGATQTLWCTVCMVDVTWYIGLQGSSEGAWG